MSETPYTPPVNPIPEPKLYTGLPFVEYVRWNALNFHTLVNYKFSPMFARHKMIKGENSTASLRLGDAAHAAIFQPEVFASQYVAAPDYGDLRTKAGKEKRDYFEASYAGSDKIIVKADEYREALGIRRSIEDHKEAAEILLTSPGLNEVSFAWDQIGSGVTKRCKGRVDRLCTFRGESVIADLKTTRNPWPRKFASDASDYEYHSQLGTYRNGLNELVRVKRRALTVAVQNEEPYEVAVYWIKAADLDRGARRFQSWLDDHCSCELAKRWPAAIRETELILPKWADADESAFN